jgi:HAD superfamily hydrolase (TIGR01509 family)
VGANGALRCVVFDLDGVIVDSEPLHERANAQYFATFGSGAVDEALLDSMMGRRVRDLTDVVAERSGRPPDEVFAERERVFWRLLGEGLEPMPGLHEALARLRAAGLTLAVASSGTRRYVAHVLDVLGIGGRFAAIATGEDVRRGKPAPDVYLLAAERLGVPPAACAAVEDAPAGVRAARAAGMRVVAVPDGRTRGMDFAGADTVVPDLVAAADWLLAPDG